MSTAVVDRVSRLAAAGAVAVALALGTGAALAQRNQGPPNALQGFSQNRDEPVKIQASALEVREKDKQAKFTGDVHVMQGDTEMRCKSLVVFYDDDGSSNNSNSNSNSSKGLKAADPSPGSGKQIRRIEAKGNVSVTQKEQNASGDTAIFDMRANTVTLVGNVIVTRGQDVLRGQRLVVDLENGVSKMDQGRVEGLFQSGSRNLEKR